MYEFKEVAPFKFQAYKDGKPVNVAELIEAQFNAGNVKKYGK